MSALATLLGTYAVGHALDHGGKSFVFGRIDQAAKAALSAGYFKRAREAVYAVKDEVSADEFDRQLSRVTDAYRRGEFAFPRGETRGYFMGEGLAELVALLTGQSLQDCQDLVAERTIETFHIAFCIFAESFPAEKKTMLSQPATPELLSVMKLLNLGTTNGSPSSSPASPSRASVPTATPG